MPVSICLCSAKPSRAWNTKHVRGTNGSRSAVAARGALANSTVSVTTPPDAVDILVIGSGVGGLCAASLLASFGKHVAVVEAHSAAGGAAHHWTRGAFSFDSGAALFSGINPLRPEEANGSDATTANPLSSVLAALGESVPDVIDMPDSATCLVYPDGKQYRCQLGSTAFADVVEERYGSEASKQWRGFQDEVDRLCVTAGAVPPAAVRLDDGVAMTAVFRRPMQFIKYMFGSSGTSSKTFGNIMDEHVTHPDVRKLITMITEGTTSAAPAEIDATYMLRAFHEMWSQNTVLQYPAEGSQAIIDTLVKGLEKNGGSLFVKTRARRVLRSSPSEPEEAATSSSGMSDRGESSGFFEGVKAMYQNAMGGSGAAVNVKDPLDTAVAVEIVGPDGCPKVVRVREAVISNASVWDTERIMTTTGVLSRDWTPAQTAAMQRTQQAEQAQSVDERVLQEANTLGTGLLMGQSTGQLAQQMPTLAVSSIEVTAGSQTAVLDRPSGASRVDVTGSFDTQSMSNPAVGGRPGEGVLDSMGSIDSEDWSASSCEWEPPVGQEGKWLREDFLDYVTNLEMNASMMHLHVGFQAREGEDLPVHTYFLESEHCGSNGWPTIVIPSATAPGLAPPGHHVLHATITEDFEPWKSLARGSREYNTRKEQRAELLWDFIRQIIPDIDDRVKVTCVGTPLSHARFLRRKCGTYGPSNLLNLTGALPKAVQPLENVWCCGDSVFPGVGTPAVAANGMWVANTLVPVERHMKMLDDLGL